MLQGKMILITVLVLGLVGGHIAYAGEDNIMVMPSEIKWANGPASLPSGAKIAVVEGDLSKAVPFTFRLKMPANYKIAPHWHTAIEHVTVLSGTFYFGAGDTFDMARAKAFPTGSIMVMPPTHTMFGWAEATADETVIQVHGVGPWSITYVNPADDPRKK